MSKKRDAVLLLEDILTCCSRILEYTKDLGFDSFINSQITLDAVERNFEIIGEASSKFDSEFKIDNPEIPWSDLKNLRNRIIHDYTGVNYEIVWDIIQNYLEELQFQVQSVLNKIQ